MLEDDGHRPSARFYAAVAPVLKAASRRRASWGRRAGAAGATCLVMAHGLIGYRLGTGEQRASVANTTTVTAGTTGVPSAPLSPTAVPAAPVGSNDGNAQNRPTQHAGRSNVWPVANGRLRFESWLEGQPGGED
jgi:hypothetical protein